jgi:hypothetical protein
LDASESDIRSIRRYEDMRAVMTTIVDIASVAWGIAAILVIVVLVRELKEADFIKRILEWRYGPPRSRGEK